MKKKAKKTVLIVIIIAIIAVICYSAWENKALELNRYEISSETLPQSFDGYRIAHVSDLHNAQMGKNNEKLLEMLCDSKPDMIAITGDLIDSRKTDVQVALDFAKEAVKIAPCYYVTGNHEARVTECEALKKGLSEIGVIVLEDERVELEKSGESIVLLGMNDPSFSTSYLFGDAETVLVNTLNELGDKDDAYRILLSHRPELYDVYVNSGVDLVLSGHAHGGQFRLPFVGGVVAPNQGMFPEYDAGLYTENNVNMIVSRGIGNSIIPLRLNNPPEVILVELKANDGQD